MPTPLDAAGVRALTERLVAISSASPDPSGESRCARVLLEAMPRGVETGHWSIPDGRPIAWARLRGGGGRATLLLGHLDTVGAAAFAEAGEPALHLALDPAKWREELLERHARGTTDRDATLRADLDEETRAPGSWMFGRGALDMKSGLAAGVAALAELASSGEPRGGDVLLVATPDEERESEGMLAAVPELRRLRDAERLQFTGALNLDYAESPGAHLGVSGKLLAGFWVLGRPTHAGSPFLGADAAQIAAHLVAHATADPALADAADARRGAPAVVLRMRDLKPVYDAQTALEAIVELNVITLERPLARTLDALERAATGSLGAWRDAQRALARRLGVRVDEPLDADPAAHVITYRDLVARAGFDPDADPIVALGPGADPRAATLGRLRALARAAALERPAIVVVLLPPYYPPASPGGGPLVRAARDVLDAVGLPVEAWYPYISDASYLAWREPGVDGLATHLPALGREYRLPVEDIAALDLDVVNLGPWGRDAHGLHERVRCDWTFERLPGLVAAIVRASLAP